MDLNEYQAEAAKIAIYPAEVGLLYTTLGLAGEAGEVANKVKKIVRGDYNNVENQRREQRVALDQIAQELGDVLWYVAMTAKELGYSLEDIANNNLSKLAYRASVERLKGSGDDR